MVGLRAFSPSGGSAGYPFGGILSGPIPSDPADIARWDFDTWVNTMIPPGARPGESINEYRDEVAGETLSMYINCTASPTPSNVAANFSYGGLDRYGRYGLSVGNYTGMARRNNDGSALPSNICPASFRVVSQSIHMLMRFPGWGAGTTPGTNQLGSSSSRLFFMAGPNGATGQAENVWNSLTLVTATGGSNRCAYLVYQHMHGGNVSELIYFNGLDMPTGDSVLLSENRVDNGDGTCSVQMFLNGQQLSRREYSGASAGPDAMTNPTGGNYSGPLGGFSVGLRDNIVNNGAPFVLYGLSIKPAMTASQISALYQSMLK